METKLIRKLTLERMGEPTHVGSYKRVSRAWTSSGGSMSCTTGNPSKVSSPGPCGRLSMVWNIDDHLARVDLWHLNKYRVDPELDREDRMMFPSLTQMSSSLTTMEPFSVPLGGFERRTFVESRRSRGWGTDCIEFENEL